MPPYVKCNEEYGVDTNPYLNVYVDLTYRCNMACNYCYNPMRDGRDMELSYFAEVCKRLPFPIFFRFLGGEPALHPQFFDFILMARNYGHHVYFSSNGLVYTDENFVRELKRLQVTYAPGLTMDGGYSGREIYEKMNGGDYLDRKLQALENLDRHDIRRVTLSAIITRGINESTIPELIALADRYKKVVRYIHFRTAAKIGRWVDTEPYTLAELKELVRPYFTAPAFQPKCVREISCPPEAEKDCCYRFHPTRRLQVSLIEFATPKSAACKKRGKLLDQSFTIQPLFKNMIETGKIMARQPGATTGEVRP